MATERENPYSTFNFLVDLGTGDTGSIKAGFQEVSGLNIEVSSAEYRNGNEKVNHVRKINTMYKVGDITLKRGMTSNLDLWNWFRLAAGNNQRGLLAQGVVLMKGADMTPVLRFSLTDCLPIKLKAAALNAKDGSIAIEELQIAYSSFTVQPA